MKHPVLVDTQGLVLYARVHLADVQDRDGGLRLLTALQKLFPQLRELFADAAYQGPPLRQGVALLRRPLEVDIVKRCAPAPGFIVLPKRWIVGRTVAWLNRCRRLAKDWAKLNLKALAFLRLAICLMLRKNCNPKQCLWTAS